MIKKVLFLILTVASLGFAMHKYYVSITEAEYNDKSQLFEISIKFIGHDLEEALINAGAPELYLGTSNEIEEANSYLKKYISQRFKMIVDGKELSYKFIGKEVNNDDFIYCYLESNQVTSLHKIEIKNSLLTEVFDKQANTVYLKVGDQKINYSLNKGRVSESHELKK